MEGQLSLARELLTKLPAEPQTALLKMVDRYWEFMLENKQIYRLMNGMDGVPIDRERVGDVARQGFEAATSIVQAWLIAECGKAYGAGLLVDELWAVLHGMAVLHLDRYVPFDRGRARDCVATLLMGTRAQARKLRRSADR